MPKTPAQIKAIHQEKRSLIVQTALQLFAERGYHSSSISQIAKQAGISKGLIYNYFESKDAILETIILDGINLMMSSLNGITEITDKKDLSQIIINSMEMTKSHAAFFRLYFGVLTQKEVSEKFKSRIFEMVEPFLSLFSKYYASQGYPNPDIQALLLGSVLDGVGMDYLLSPEEYPLEEIIPLIIEKFS